MKCAKIKKIAQGPRRSCVTTYTIQKHDVWYRSLNLFGHLYLMHMQMMESVKEFLTTLMMGIVRKLLLRRSPQDNGQKITAMMLKNSFKRCLILV